MPTPTKEEIILEAEQVYRAFDLYRNFWRGPEWKLVMIRRNVSTELGVAFVRGDVSIAALDKANPGWVTVYSRRNEINTRLAERDVVEVVDLQKFVPVRQRLERLASQFGIRALKEACCELILDDGGGQNARRALGRLRSCDFRHGDVEDAIAEIERLLVT